MTDPILAAAFANADASDQASLLDSFARELFVRCGGRIRRGSQLMEGYEQQCCMITQKLGADGVALIEDLHAFVVLRKEEIKP